MEEDSVIEWRTGGLCRGCQIDQKLTSPMETLSSCSRTIAFVPTRHPLTNVPFLLPSSRSRSVCSSQQQNAVVVADEITLDSQVAVFRTPDQEFSGKSDGLSR